MGNNHVETGNTPSVEALAKEIGAGIMTQNERKMIGLGIIVNNQLRARLNPSMMQLKQENLSLDDGGVLVLVSGGGGLTGKIAWMEKRAQRSLGDWTIETDLKGLRKFTILCGVSGENDSLEVDLEKVKKQSGYLPGEIVNRALSFLTKTQQLLSVLPQKKS